MKQKIKDFILKQLRKFKWFQSRESMVNYGFFQNRGRYKKVKLFFTYVYVFVKDKNRDIYVWEDKFGELYLATSRWSKRTHLDGSYKGLDFFSRGDLKKDIDRIDISYSIHQSIINALDYLGIDRKTNQLIESIIAAEICNGIAQVYSKQDNEMYIMWLKAQNRFLDQSRKNDPNQKELDVEDFFKPTGNYTAELYHHGKKVWRQDDSGFNQYINNDGSRNG